MTALATTRENPQSPMNTALGFWRSTLLYFAKSSLAVILGVALATSVITGALLVGDSVRGSLEQLSLERLGRIDHVVIGPRFFRQNLVETFNVAAGTDSTTNTKSVGKPRGIGTLAPAIIVTGSLQTGPSRSTTSRRAGHVEVYGVDDTFWKLAQVESPGQGMAISRRLADQLELKVGDQASLVIEIPPTIPRDALLGEREETVVELPTQISRIFADYEMPGRFGLNPSQQLPLNAFVDLQELQTQLNLQHVPASARRQEPEKPARINAILIDVETPLELAEAQFSQSMAEHLTTILHQQLRLDDLSLRLIANESHHYLSLESERMLIDDATITSASQVAKDNGWSTSPVLVSLLTEIANPRSPNWFSMYPISAGVGASSIPSTFEEPQFISGAAPQSDQEIVLNDWLAEDLHATTGDQLTVKYKVVGDTGELPELTRTVKVAGIVKLAGAAGDPGLTPYVQGISDAEDPTKWREPFPLQKERITDRDRAYWKPYRTTPKVFWELRAAEELFKSRYGSKTSLRIAPPIGVSLTDFAKSFENQWRSKFDTHLTGLVATPVKWQGLQAARGTTDFTGLFLGFSLFLIASALLLVSLLFRLGLDGRSREFGLLMGVGWTSKSVGRMILSQGLTLAAIGGAIGVVGGVLYASLMITGLTTWWSDAVGTRALYLHVRPTSLMTGWLIAVVISAVLIWNTSRQLRRMAPRSLLNNATMDSPGSLRRQGRRKHATLHLSMGLSIILLMAGVLGLIPTSEAFAGFSLRTVAFFVGGLSALVACLSALAVWLDADSATTVHGRGVRALATLAVRNAARNRSRSLLTVSLIACSTFLVVAVASGRRNPAVEAPVPRSGNGGFTLVAETNQPILYDLNTTAGRTKAGVNLRRNTESESLLSQIRFASLRMKPGENSSCLNLYQTQSPTILGVPQAVIDEFTRDGRFKFADTRSSTPWDLITQRGPGGEIPVLGDMNTLQYSLHKGIGSTIEMEDATKQTQKLVVRGMLDGSVFQGVLLMSEENLLRLFPDTVGYRYFLIEVDPQLASSVVTLLESDLADSGFDAERVADRLANYLAVQNTYLSTFQTLGGLGLLLGTVGLGVVMMRNVWERRSELALLRAVGFSNRMLRCVVLFENACLLSVGLLSGTIAAAVAMAPHLMSIGADVSWVGLGTTLAVVFVTGMLSCLAAVREVVRLPMLMALRTE